MKFLRLKNVHCVEQFHFLCSGITTIHAAGLGHLLLSQMLSDNFHTLDTINI